MNRVALLAAQAPPHSLTVLAALLLVGAVLLLMTLLTRMAGAEPEVSPNDPEADRHLLEVGRWLAATPPSDEDVARTARRAAERLFAPRRFGLARLKQSRLSPVSSAPDEGAGSPNQLLLAYRVMAAAARAKAPVWRSGPHGRSALIAPIRSHRSALGVFVVELDRDPQDRVRQERLASQFSDWLGPALERVQLREEAERRGGQLLLLAEISQRLISLRPLEERWNNVTPLVSQIFGLAEVSIYELEDEVAVPVAASHETAADLPIVRPGQGLAGRALDSYATALLTDIDPQLKDRELATPLMVEDRLLGVLVLKRREGPAFTQEEIGLAKMLAGQLAIAALEARNFSQQQEYTWYNTVMLEVTRHAAQPGDVETALRAVLQLTTMLAGAKWALLLLAQEASDRLVLGPSSGVQRSALEALREAKLAPRSLGLEPPYDERDAPLPTSLPPPLSTALEVKECLALPLSDGQNLLGVLLVSGASPMGPRRRLIAGIAHQISLRIENSRLVEDLAGQRALERELETARNIQESFLPQDVPSPIGWEVGVTWLAARQVGGDFFDFIPLPDGPNGPRWGVVVADVADKGVPAALFMALCRTLVRSIAVSTPDPGEVLSRTNHLILADTRADLFVSLFYGLWDPSQETLRYANAGHNPPIVHDPVQGLRLLRDHGMVLGVSPGAKYETHRLTLPPGGTMVMYTDGVTEASNRDGDLFGLDRICEIVQARASLSAQLLAQHINDAVLDFCTTDDPPDDLTTVIVRRTQS